VIRRRLGNDRERGVSAVEFAVLMPVFLPLIFLLVQAGLYFHAVNVIQAVAQTTGRVIRTYPGSPGQADPTPGSPGQADPTTVLPTQRQLQDQASRVAVETWQQLDANKTAEQPVAAVDLPLDGTNQVTVTITSRCVNLLPGILPTLPVTAKASGPIEIFKPQGTN
jgi:Flp pilus assembly protein TadG